MLLLVGGILFEIATGVLNIQYDYIFGFSFYTAHYYGAWVFIAGFVVHVAIKLPRMITGLRSRSFRTELRTSRADTQPEPPDPDGLVAANPAPPTLSRRGALALVGAGSLFVAVLTAGQTIGGFTRGAALLLPRGRSLRQWPQRFPGQPNRCGRRDHARRYRQRLAVDTARPGGAAAAGPGGPRWRCPSTPPSCRSPASRAGQPPRPGAESGSGIWPPSPAYPTRPEPRCGRWNGLAPSTTPSCRPIRCGNPDSLLALRVNGVDLSPDHGYPARIIVPALPGVHNTKWVRSIEFGQR